MLSSHQMNLHNRVIPSSINTSIYHSTKLTPLFTKTSYFPLNSLTTTCKATTPQTPSSSSFCICSSESERKSPENSKPNFWGAVSLIIGTAVGPGMLGLPSTTIKSGPLPSTLAILLSWVYVISSILLVAELTFASMKQDGVGEVSFTGLATTAFGPSSAAFVAVVYACLTFSLIVACVSGMGSIISQWFPSMNSLLAHALFPCITWVLTGFFPFQVIDSANRLLCFVMLFSITALVATGLSVGRTNVLTSFAYASWAPSAILPAIPITVLTLGFHVITPFVCKIVGKSGFDARKAILMGGAVPLIMVLSWNLVVLGLAGTNTASPQNPISLLLSVNSAALPAVQGFAFTALATSLIGYSVSFPKQLLDTLELIWRETNLKQTERSPVLSDKSTSGGVGFAIFSRGDNVGSPGQVTFLGPRFTSHLGSEKLLIGASASSSVIHIFVMTVVLGASVLVTSFFPTTFSKALDFAGVYANCFLFGILPPAMAWIYRSKRKFRSQASEDADLLPGGNIALALLFGIAVALAIWH